jgi:hypothetical protein
MVRRQRTFRRIIRNSLGIKVGDFVWYRPFYEHEKRYRKYKVLAIVGNQLYILWINHIAFNNLPFFIIEDMVKTKDPNE